MTTLILPHTPYRLSVHPEEREEHGRGRCQGTCLISSCLFIYHFLFFLTLIWHYFTLTPLICNSIASFQLPSSPLFFTFTSIQKSICFLLQIISLLIQRCLSCLCFFFFFATPLKANLPLLQRELLHCARLAKQTPAQYLAQHEQLLLDTSTTSPVDSSELLLDVNENGKRRTPDRCVNSKVIYLTEKYRNKFTPVEKFAG